MKNTQQKTKNLFKAARWFESSLIAVAIFLGWMAGINPFAFLVFSERAIVFGLVGTLPLFLAFLAIRSLPLAAIQKITTLLLASIVPYLYQRHWTDLLVLAVIAGVAEELLFRGVIQPWMENSWGAGIGLIGSSILFGLLHAITPLYALLATSVSIYLGCSLDYGGERNLLTPIVIHSAYDYLVFLALIKTYKKQHVDRSG